MRCETGFVLSWSLGHRVAKFQQVNKGRSNVHRDALEFPDGKIVPLTQLCEGQRATVLQLPALPRVTADNADLHDLLAMSSQIGPGMCSLAYAVARALEFCRPVAPRRRSTTYSRAVFGAA